MRLVKVKLSCDPKGFSCDPKLTYIKLYEHFLKTHTNGKKISTLHPLFFLSLFFRFFTLTSLVPFSLNIQTYPTTQRK
jgi:hypothetical protein